MSNYRNNESDLTAVFKALSNEHRLKIFRMLSGCCEPGTVCSTQDIMACCVSEIGEQLDIASSTLSHHLKELSQAGLIETQRNGKQIMCSINTDMLEQLYLLFAKPGR